MKDQLIAAFLGGAIALTGYHFVIRPPEVRPPEPVEQPRYQIAASSNWNAAWRIDTVTGAVSRCAVRGGAVSPVVRSCILMEEALE